MLFVSLYILPKLEFSVSTIIEFPPVYNLGWTCGGGNSCAMWEAVQPEYGKLDEFNYHLLGDPRKGESVVNASSPLLDGSVVPFHIANMLVTACCVKQNTIIRKITAEFFILAISEQVRNTKASEPIDPENIAKDGPNMLFAAALKNFNGGKL